MERIQRVGRYVQDEVMPLIADIEPSGARSILLGLPRKRDDHLQARSGCFGGEASSGNKRAMINRSLLRADDRRALVRRQPRRGNRADGEQHGAIERSETVVGGSEAISRRLCDGAAGARASTFPMATSSPP